MSLNINLIVLHQLHLCFNQSMVIYCYPFHSSGYLLDSYINNIRKFMTPN